MQISEFHIQRSKTGPKAKYMAPQGWLSHLSQCCPHACINLSFRGSLSSVRLSSKRRFSEGNKGRSSFGEEKWYGDGSVCLSVCVRGGPITQIENL